MERRKVEVESELFMGIFPVCKAPQQGLQLLPRYRSLITLVVQTGETEALFATHAWSSSVPAEGHPPPHSSNALAWWLGEAGPQSRPKTMACMVVGVGVSQYSLDVGPRMCASRDTKMLVWHSRPLSGPSRAIQQCNGLCSLVWPRRCKGESPLSAHDETSVFSPLAEKLILSVLKQEEFVPWAISASIIKTSSQPLCFNPCERLRGPSDVQDVMSLTKHPHLASWFRWAMGRWRHPSHHWKYWQPSLDNVKQSQHSPTEHPGTDLVRGDSISTCGLKLIPPWGMLESKTSMLSSLGASVALFF